MELPDTLNYLRLLSSCADDYKVPYNNSYLLETLMASLRNDGYQLLSTQTSSGIYSLSAEHPISISPDDAYHTAASTRLLINSDKGSPDLTSIIMVVVCVIFAALASGLTQGLLSLDLMEMEIKVRSGTELEKKYASKVIPLISRHHLLLVSLMLWNASATEALPIFLSKLVPEFLAVIISVTLVLFAGEIIPASILTGPNQLPIASNLTPLVYFVLCVFFPIAYPISLCLDCIIGHEAGITMYNRKEIATLMTIQREQGLKQREIERSRKHNSSTASRTLRWSLRNFSQAADTSPPQMHHHHLLERDLESSRHSFISVMEEDEVDIINGALKYRDMLVSAVMTPLSAVYMISAHELLSYKTLYEIFKSGYSRIPVYNRDPDDIIGLLLAKDLLFIDPEDLTPVQNFIDLFGRKPGNVLSDCKLGETLRKFRNEKAHMAIVREAPDWVDIKDGAREMHTDRVVGIITLEDIIEEILGTEIEDETDGFKARPVDAEGTPIEPMRDVGLARLRTMHSSQILDADQLTEEEVHSVEIFLITNVPQIQHLFKGSSSGSDSLQSFIRSSAVISMTRKSDIDCSPSHEDFLYRKGKMTNTCTLILRGSVAIESSLLASLSNDVVLKSEWNIIAIEALTKPEGTFVPDFSAYISSEHIRFLSMAKYTTPKLVKDPSAGVSDEGLNEFIKFRKKIHRSPGIAGPSRRSITTAGPREASAEQQESPVPITTDRPHPIDLLQFSKVRSTTGHLTSSILRRGRYAKERGSGSEDSMMAPLLPERNPGEEVAIVNLVRSDTR